MPCQKAGGKGVKNESFNDQWKSKEKWKYINSTGRNEKGI